MESSSSSLLITPNEISCRIFELSYQNSDYSLSIPLAISHVCRSWRQIAINDPFLWTHIDLEEKPSRLLYANLCAERAANLPLNITVRYKSVERINPSNQLSVVWWLRTRSHSIRSLRIIHIVRSQSNPLLGTIPLIYFPNLQKFDLLGLEEVNLDLKTIADILSKAPSIRSLSLSGLESLVYHQSMQNSAHTLTHLSIGALSHIDYAFPLRVDAALEVIACCTNLRDLQCFTLGDEEDMSPAITILPYLSSLTIGDGAETCQLLSYLSAPLLQTFRIAHGKIINEREEEITTTMADTPDDRDGYEDSFVECFDTFFQASNAPRITRLIWEGCVVGFDLLIRCAPYLQSLEDVELCGMQNVLGSIFISHRENSSSGVLYPHMQSLLIIGCSINPEWYHDIQVYLNSNPEHSNRCRVKLQRCSISNVEG